MSILQLCYFSSLLWIEEMYVWYLSTLFVWPQFILTTNKSKGGDCWLFEYWLHLLILMYDVRYDVPTSWHGLVCPVYVARLT